MGGQYNRLYDGNTKRWQLYNRYYNTIMTDLYLITKKNPLLIMRHYFKNIKNKNEIKREFYVDK